MNDFILNMLIERHGLQVVGDHPDYLDSPHERGLRYAQRVDEILRDCAGIVVALPKKEWVQTTTAMIFLEILLAAQHGLPMLVFQEEGVVVDWRHEGAKITATFGNSGVTPIITPGDIDANTFHDVALLKQARTIEFETSAFCNRPKVLPLSPDGDQRLANEVSSLVEEFTQCLRPPESPAYVFNIMPYAKAHERLIIATAVSEETGLPCVNGSDQWAGAPYKREELIEKIVGARLVIADLSGQRSACIYEVGIAVGARRDVCVVSRPSRRGLPFGPDRLTALHYTTDKELDRAVRDHCRPYRRWVFNTGRRVKGAGPNRVSPKHRTVILVHGIRTQAAWQERVRSMLSRSSPTNKVEPVKYGFLDLLRFWWPFGTRQKAIDILKWKIAKATRVMPDHELVVIAHSFGTYAVAKMLQEVPSFRPDRVLFCGSIVPQHFRWDQLDNPPDVVNDCSVRDRLPVLATVASWGYGPSGTFGFGTPGVHDRFHEVSHSGYFSESFVEQFWLPWVNDGVIVDGKTVPPPPYWTLLLTVNGLRAVILLAILAAFFVLR